MQLDAVAPRPFATDPCRDQTPNQARFLSWLADILVYTLVLNLFVEYLPRVVIESFSISIITAILLKLLLDSILGFEHRVAGWFSRRDGQAWRMLGLLTMFSILFLSKFVVLELTHLVFGGRVYLGGLIEVVLLIVTLIAARQALAVIYYRVLGKPSKDLIEAHP